MTPTKIGRYEVISELGRGGMATVYKAHDPSFDREVAVKVLPREFLHDPQFRGRFEREIKTVAQLEHPAIVPVYDVGEDDGQPFFVMRNMTGGSLSDMLKQGAFSLEDTARIVERLCKGLAFAHKKGIIHRDLKPGNVLFDNNSEAFISDFGVAKLADAAQGMTGSGIVGTPAYMSPEQAQSGHVDARSDIYAMGVIVYEMLTGQQPYRADTPMGVVVKHITDPVPEILQDNPALPPEVDAIIKKAMDKNPDNRYSTLIDLAMALNKVAFGDTGATRLNDSQLTHPMAPGALPKFKAGVDKKLFVWIGAGVGTVILIVAAFLLLRGGPAAVPLEPSPTVTATVLSQPTAIPSTPTLYIPPFGGADKFALLSNNNIWLMNPDGSEAQPLTGDASPKKNLQWLPDGKTLLYVSETCVYTIDIALGSPKQLTCFQEVKSGFDAFRVSPDGKRVAISLDMQLIIVPFDTEALAGAKKRGDLSKMDGACVDNRVSVKDVRWSNDGTKLAAVYLDTTGVVADQIRMLDVSHCEAALPIVLGSFPGRDFTIKGFKSNPTFSAFDWDGDQTFVFTDAIRNGFGNLYFYDTKTQEARMYNPIEDTCCYRDPRFSPDGTYLLFLFQDSRTDQAAYQLYFSKFNEDGSLDVGEPISLPLGIFPGQRESPQPAIRAIQQ